MKAEETIKEKLKNLKEFRDYIYKLLNPDNSATGYDEISSSGIIYELIQTENKIKTLEWVLKEEPEFN